MYQLLRNGSIAPVVEDEVPDLMSCPGGDPGRLEYRTSLGLEDWRHFIAGGELENASPLVESWRRCRNLGVDPAMPACSQFAPAPLVRDQLDLLEHLGREVESMVMKALGGRDLLMTVTDASGRILRTVGSKKVLTQADSLRFGPGAVWSEESVGTNAISLALDTGMPWQVMGTEHFCCSHHKWGCSATPIYSYNGGLWGCVDISGNLNCSHEKALWLTIYAAREIERRLLAHSMSDVERFSRRLFKAAFGSISSGLCIVDDRGVVTFANPQAHRLLAGALGQASGSARAGELLGRAASTLFGCPGSTLVEALRAGRMLTCPVNRDLVVEVTPFLFKEKIVHFVLLLHEGRPDVRVAVPDELRHEGRPPVCALGLGCSENVAAAKAGTPRVRRSKEDPFAAIAFRSDVMREVVERARTMARSDAPVLVLGETGTGKELFARALHQASARAKGRFVAVNCGALPRELVQSELFGYEKGSFTGATRPGPGKFELAHGGTLFLDEISEMPLDMQVNLLRPLETRRVTRVGGSRSLPADFRLVTATNRNLEELVAGKHFREDLYYRIHVLLLELPPLRERREDIALLAETFARRLARRHRLHFAGLADDALACLESCPWPGNVRQLEHGMAYAVNMAMGARITAAHLPRTVSCSRDTCAGTQGQPCATQEPDFSLSSMERRTIESALRHHEGNILQTARSLGIGRNTLYAKMRKYRIS